MCKTRCYDGSYEWITTVVPAAHGRGPRIDDWVVVSERGTKSITTCPLIKSIHVWKPIGTNEYHCYQDPWSPSTFATLAKSRVPGQVAHVFDHPQIRIADEQRLKRTGK